MSSPKQKQSYSLYFKLKLLVNRKKPLICLSVAIRTIFFFLFDDGVREFFCRFLFSYARGIRVHVFVYVLMVDMFFSFSRSEERRVGKGLRFCSGRSCVLTAGR